VAGAWLLIPIGKKQSFEGSDRCLPASDKSAGQDQGARGARNYLVSFYSKRVDGDALPPPVAALGKKREAGYATLFRRTESSAFALALALINDPQNAFFSMSRRPVLDPQVRLEIRDLIEELARGEKGGPF